MDLVCCVFILKKRISIVDNLLKSQADIDICSKRGYSALYLACHNNYVDLPKKVFQHNVIVNSST